MHLKVLLVFMVVVLQGCANPHLGGTGSLADDTIVNGPSLRQVQRQVQKVTESASKPATRLSPHSATESTAESFQGAAVRWGGELVSVQQQAGGLQVELVQRTLDRRGKPRSSSPSSGRFLAFIPPGVLDVAQASELASAQQRQLLTVLGVLGNSVDGVIGDQPYRFTVVEVQIVRLWGGSRGHYPRYFRYAPDLDPWPYEDPFLPYIPHRFHRGRYSRFPYYRSHLHLQFDLNRHADWFIEDLTDPWYQRRWWAPRVW